MGIVCYSRHGRRSRRLLSPISAWKRGGRADYLAPLPSSLSPSPSLFPSFQLHTRSPQALIARQPALSLPATAAVRPLTRSFARCHCCCIGRGRRRRAGRCFLSSSKLGLALPEKPSVAADDGQWHGRSVGRLDYLSVQVTVVRTEVHYELEMCARP